MGCRGNSRLEVEDWREHKGIRWNSQGNLSEERQRESKEAKMAGKKDAKSKASPCDRTEKNKEKREEFQ
jgi:hypothetical protein